MYTLLPVQVRKCTKHALHDVRNTCLVQRAACFSCTVQLRSISGVTWLWSIKPSPDSGLTTIPVSALLHLARLVLPDLLLSSP